MGSSQVSKCKLAIFGGGRVGTAMSLEMPGVPVVRRGEDCECEVAVICWPAHAVGGFSAAHPAAAGSHKVAFSNGVWAVGDGADEQGCCYVRAIHLGDRAKPGRNGWRVGVKSTASALRGAGLGVTLSRGNEHRRFVWEKCLYLVPLALAVRDTPDYAGVGRLVTESSLYAEWYDAVRSVAVADIGEAAVSRCEPRVRFLLSRTPHGWTPSPSPEELAYFEDRLCAD